MEVIDFYTGFEGEPELEFSYKIGDKSKRFVVWTGYFDTIMEAITPSPEGWSGLAYYYHLNEGWYDKADWQIPDLQEAIEQLESVNQKVGLVEEVRYKLTVFLRDALINGVPVKMFYS